MFLPSAVCDRGQLTNNHFLKRLCQQVQIALVLHIVNDGFGKKKEKKPY